uniref:Cyclin-dependent kinase G-2 n=1 Tax=Lygus hesperus TaxID=30085 RepID=A0A0A9WWK9_LYGHE
MVVGRIDDPNTSSAGDTENEIYMVMEFCDHDLKMLMRGMDRCFKQCEVKCMMLQLLHALHTLHKHSIVHRDLKTSNILLTQDGVLKVADFGSARHYSSLVPNYTCPVITLWYRPPELLYSSKIRQNPAIDMWSLGCIFAEMVLGRALFQGRGEIDQLQTISKVLGVPSHTLRTLSTVPEVHTNLATTAGSGAGSSGFNSTTHQPPTLFTKLRKSIPVETYNDERCLSNTGFELLCSMLQLEPRRRISAEQALQHPYFREHPTPIQPHQMPKYTSFNANPDERERARRRMNEFGDHNLDTYDNNDPAVHVDSETPTPLDFL